MHSCSRSASAADPLHGFAWAHQAPMRRCGSARRPHPSSTPGEPSALKPHHPALLACVAQGANVYVIPLGGTLLRVPYAIGGSGSAYITGFCDKHFRPNMSEEEAKQVRCSATIPSSRPPCAAFAARHASCAATARMPARVRGTAHREHTPALSPAVPMPPLAPVCSSANVRPSVRVLCGFAVCGQGCQPCYGARLFQRRLHSHCGCGQGWRTAGLHRRQPRAADVWRARSRWQVVMQ
jgi:hypothetical protein